MSLEDYILNGPSVVIADDERDPYVSWQHHLDRTANDPGGPRGGVDLVATVGTPVYAPTDGTLERVPNDGGAGNSTRFWHDKNIGWADVFSHLSSYVLSVSGNNWYRQGELIAYSGDTGGVTQHLHRHLLDPNGVRRNPWDYFTNATPNNNNSKDDDMDPFIVVAPDGDWFLICRNQNGLYASPLGKNDTWTGKNNEANVPNAPTVFRFADNFGYSTFKSGIFNAAAVKM